MFVLLQRYGKLYKDDLEELRRYTIWQSKRVYVNEHNSHANRFGYTLAMNTFSDMSDGEINMHYKGLKMTQEFADFNASRSTTRIFKSDPKFDAPQSLDWREVGAVTSVKNQKQCGSCWSFSATGAIEGQHYLKTNQLVSVSEQNLIDCSRGYGSLGCNGGNPIEAFAYVRDNGGIDTEGSYPYEVDDEGTCRFSSSSVGATVSGYVQVPSSESALLEAVTTVGPISVAIDASHNSYQLYHSGVYYEPLCSSSNLDHAVLVVGYGTQDGQDYWLVKNSWGSEDWGMDGYMMMARNMNNNCGIATFASYPTV
jgi:cathepsin L